MKRLISALILALLIATPSLGQQSLVGTYNIVSHEVRYTDGTTMQVMGKAPHGYLVLTPTRYLSFYTADNRKFGTSDADKAALLDTLSGWSGTYRIEGSKMIIAVDVSWTEVWTGKDLVRNWELSGNRFTLTSDPQPDPRNLKTHVVQTVWEKTEIAPPSLGQQSLVGTYKIVSHEAQVGDSIEQPLGKSPHGYLVITPTELIYFMTAENRKFGTSVADKAALLDTLSAFSGAYRVEGNKLFIKGDASWLENWTGKDQVRTWELLGNRLRLTVSGQHPRTSKAAIGRMVWEKIE